MKKGYRRSEETKMKISKTLRGHLVSEETRKKLSMALKGRYLSEEHKRKLSEAHKGEKNPMFGKKGELSPVWKGGISKSKEHYRLLSKEWVRKNKERHRLSVRKWKEKNKEYVKFLRREWRKKNRARVNFATLRRIARKRNAEGSHTFGEWQTLKAQYNYTCPACGRKEPEIKLTEDHIIPLSRGGSDNIENIQPLCRSCNSKKYTKIIKYEI